MSEAEEDANPRTWMTIVGQAGGFFAVLCLNHGEFWSSDFASVSQLDRAIDHHIRSEHADAARPDICTDCDGDCGVCGR